MTNHDWKLPKNAPVTGDGRCLWKCRRCGCFGLAESQLVSPPSDYPVFFGKKSNDAFTGEEAKDCDLSLIKGVLQS
jgi:hypothetical protein